MTRAPHALQSFRQQIVRLSRHAWLAFAGLAVLSFGRHLSNVSEMPEGATMGDWRDATFYAMRSVLGGDNPYDHVAYLAEQPVTRNFPPYTPHHLTLHLPFSLEPIEFSASFWFLVNMALGVWLAWLVVRVARTTMSWPMVWIIASVILISDFGQINQFGGEDATEMAIGALLLFGGFANPWVRALGFVFVAQKLNWLLPAGLLALALGDGKALTRGIGATVALGLPMAIPAMIAAGGPFDLIEDVLDGLDYEAGVPSNSLLSDVLARFDPAGSIGRLLNIGGGRAGELTIMAAVMLAAAWLIRRADRLGQPRGLRGAVVLLAFLLAVPHHMYDGVAFVAAMAMLVVDQRSWIRSRLTVEIGAIIIAVLTVGHYLHEVLFWVDWPHWERAGVFGPFLIVVALMTAVGLYRSEPLRLLESSPSLSGHPVSGQPDDRGAGDETAKSAMGAVL